MRRDSIQRRGRSGISARASILAVAPLLALALAGGCTCDEPGTDSAPGTDTGTDGATDSGGSDGGGADSGGTDAGSDASVGTDATASDAGAVTPCGPLSCDTATEICVADVAFRATYACEPVPPGCESDRTCACVGATLCTGGFYICTDGPGDNTVLCECPAC